MNFFGDRKVSAGLAALALGTVFLFGSASAQDAQQGAQQGTGQPARAVRLSYVDGQVKLAQGNQVLAAQAVANTPLFEGMQLTTADNGKAEIQFEDGSVARIAPDSSLTLQVLRGAGSTADAELTLNSGLAYFEFQGGGQAGQMIVHFGPGVATTSGFTDFRVNMDTPPGSLAVFSGNLHLQVTNSSTAISASVDLHGDESVALDPADPTQFSVAESIEPNSWDAWDSDRDQALTAEAANQTGAPSNLGESENPAWNDLDASGSWYDVPGQGYVWSPYEAANADFDPYGNGDWMYTPTYGYVWASGYSWGYMPYQCGAWNFYNGFGWGWAPGMGGCRPWWGVGFYGGPNIGFAPIGYRPISRPFPPRGPGGPIGHRPVPVIPVNRHAVLANTGLPARDKNAQVMIAGSSVEPLHPLPSRPVYSRESFTSGRNQGAPNAGATSSGGQPATPRNSYSGSRPADRNVAPIYTGPPRPAPEEHSRPAPSYSPPPSYSAPRTSSGGGGSSHPSSGSAPHSSSGGGGGGGASHSSSGGGGGGASHSSGGGGGGSHSGGHR